MGSGKGKQNRAQSNTDQLWYDLKTSKIVKTPVIIDHAKWTEFVDKQNLTNVRLSDYYNIPLQPRTGTTGLPPLRNYTNIVKEVVHDLVDIGTLTLPTGATTEDLKFVTGHKNRGDWDATGVLAVTAILSKSRKQEAILWQPDIVLKNNTKFGSRQANDIVTRACTIVEKLFT